MSESLFDANHQLTLQSFTLKLTYNASELGWNKKTDVSSSKLPKFNVSDYLPRSFKYSKNNNDEQLPKLHTFINGNNNTRNLRVNALTVPFLD